MEKISELQKALDKKPKGKDFKTWSEMAKAQEKWLENFERLFSAFQELSLAKYHDKVQRLCDLWVSHIEATDHQVKNPYFFQLARLTRDEKNEFAIILKELLDNSRK